MALVQSNVSRPTFLVWDSDGVPPDGDWFPVLWRAFGETGSTVGYSVPRQVEEQADELRARFLGWLYDLGETIVDGIRVVDHLALRPGFSYWWMTLLAEKSYAKSPRLIEAVKILALEDLVNANSARKIILASGDKTLAHVFRAWCRNASLAFEWRRLKAGSNPARLIRTFYRCLPYPAQALATLLRHLWQQWPLRRPESIAPSTSGREITIVDVLFNLTPNALATGEYGSYYWTDLVNALATDAGRVNWLHHYLKHSAVPNAKHARQLIARFNQNSRGSQSHMMLDSALGWPVIWGAMHDYGRIAMASIRLGKLRYHFRPLGTKADLWPLFEQDWRSSTIGPTAVSNCLFLNLFESALMRLPCQDLGIYLQENQAWEMALVHAWRAAGHGRLVGVRHSTISFWDLRFYFDPRAYERTDKNDLPLPDVVALNSPVAVAAYRKGGYPGDQIVEVEALRYLFLSDLHTSRGAGNEKSKHSLRVLVFGDYLPLLAHQQMQWLSEAAHLLPPDIVLIVKPHPACPIKASDYPLLRMQITGSPLAELLADCNVVYTSNTTSAAVDAYSAGIPVVSVLDGNMFNLSPLRGLPGVAFVTNPEELAMALLHARNSEESKNEPYFCLDKQLLRWRRLLELRKSEFV